jgi:hypothetical protein
VDLYGLAPEEFTAARDAAAKDDRSLKALRRPTVSAWVVNTLVRADSDLLDDLAALGAQLAAAQREGRGDDLRQLAEQRRQLVATVTKRAIGLVDREVTPAVRTEVEQTLEAALSDPASADAVRTGQLVRALSFAGFGGVDLEGAVASLPRPAPVPRQTARTPKARASTKTAGREAGKPDTSTAERKALEAAGALDDAVRRAQIVVQALDAQEADLERAKAAEKEADVAITEAQRALLDVEAQAKNAHRRRIAAHKERDVLARQADNVTKTVVTAQDAADAARVALDTLRRG